MPKTISKSCQRLIKCMLEKDPENRPSIYQVLSYGIVSKRVNLITNDYILGVPISKRIIEQLV